MHEAEIKRARDNYLFSCGLALVAAVIGIAAHSLSESEGPRLGTELVLVGVAALGIFGWVLLKVRRAGAGPSSPEQSRSTGRLRKMALLWSGLAAALGASLLRTPVTALLDGTTAELAAAQWILAAAGLVIVGLAIWRIGASLAQKVDHG